MLVTPNKAQTLLDALFYLEHTSMPSRDPSECYTWVPLVATAVFLPALSPPGSAVAVGPSQLANHLTPSLRGIGLYTWTEKQSTSVDTTGSGVYLAMIYIKKRAI